MKLKKGEGVPTFPKVEVEPFLMELQELQEKCQDIVGWVATEHAAAGLAMQGRACSTITRWRLRTMGCL